MRLARTAAETARAVAALRRIRGPLAFVPTMGALHAGHASLLERARGGGGPVVVSVFVNPLQFSPGEDFDAYPRDLERDAALLDAWGADLLFAPAAAELVREGRSVSVDPGPLGDELEGRVRPGHFRGMLTIVAKLFHLVRPDVAVFGQKDLQQAALVRAMVRDLDFGIRIEVAPTVREPDGLALSSRNAYLSPAERAAAPTLHHALRAGERAVREGERRPARVRAAVAGALARAPGLAPEYVAVRAAEDLSEVAEVRGAAAILAAARLGRVRLIDNLLVDTESTRGES